MPDTAHVRYGSHACRSQRISACCIAWVCCHGWIDDCCIGGELVCISGMCYGGVEPGSSSPRHAYYFCKRGVTLVSLPVSQCCELQLLTGAGMVRCLARFTAKACCVLDTQ